MEKRSFLFFVGFTWSSFGKILELVILFFFLNKFELWFGI